MHHILKDFDSKEFLSLPVLYRSDELHPILTFPERSTKDGSFY